GRHHKFSHDGFPVAQGDAEPVSLDFQASELAEFDFLGSPFGLQHEAGAGGNRLEQGSAAPRRIKVEVEIKDVSDLAGLVGDGGLVPVAFPALHNLLARPGVDLDAKGQAAAVQPHHRDAALLEVEVLVYDESRILLNDNGVALQ